MWYNVNILHFAYHLTPTFLRRPILLAWIKAITNPLKNVYYDWRQMRDKHLYIIDHNWQTCYMRGAFNDKFDPDLRRIYIGDGVLHETTYVYTEAEAQELYMHTEAEADTIWVYTEAETGDTGVNFIVYVPSSIVQTQLHELRAEIDFYRLGGMKYLIIEIEG
ncbi:hypothetical protein [Corallibacter sp.]|uniref:hypothetical protein n=1 Tax=Corallibacter sp. TaxID=2038084 RepID=UPI003A8F9304